jgi:hypothetical protein
VRRFFIISSSTLIVLGAVFYLIVWHAQPATIKSVGADTPVQVTKVSSTQNSSGVGPGLKPWVENFENGKLTSKFTAVEFTPQKDGSFLVDHPVSVFYRDNGQRIEVHGESGKVNCDSTIPGAASPSGQSKSLFAGPTTTPKNGSLKHVRVELYASDAATKPMEWMETDNIHFDNDILPRMYTETFVDAAGNTITADMVPVKVRGDEYELDGTGLTIVWNAQKQLEKMLIDHGQRLEIINPSKLSTPSPGTPGEGRGEGDLEKRTIADIPNHPLPAYRERGQELASADPKAMPAVVPKSPEPPVPYRAIFHDQVKIDQADHRTATADVMTVDYCDKAKTPGASPTPPKTLSNNPDAGSEVPRRAGSNDQGPGSSAYPRTGVTEKQINPPATKPTKGPITIYWTGPLLITPLKGPPLMPLSPGQTIMNLVGSPVHLTPEGSEVTAASATYRSPDGAVKLQPSAQLPMVHLTQAKGITLSTGSIDYDPATEIATLTGPSELQQMVNKKLMVADWSQKGLLHVIRVPGQPNGVDHVDLIGDVAVTHPQFKLDSRELKLDMDLLHKQGGSATEADEQLKLLTAIDNVTCQLFHPRKPLQEIDGDQLVIRTERTPDKKTEPREVIATGHVHAFDPDQSITCGFLDALLMAKAGAAPATASTDDLGAAMDVESLYAKTDVKARMKNDATADSDELRVSTVDGQQRVDLWGASGAMLKDGKGSWLTGPTVHLWPANNGVSVDGAGKMETIRKASTTQPSNAAPPKPIDVTWAKSMIMDGKANTVNVHGNVKVENIDTAGDHTITGDDAHIDLVDSPKNTKTATQSTDSGGKQVKMLTLTGHVVGVSELDDATGKPTQLENLYGNKLIYTAADATAVIPGPGKLYVENHKADPSNASARGEMAIKWDTKLTYNQNTQQINIDGNTRVGFEQEGKTDQPAKPQVPMQMDSQQLIIDLVKANPEKGKPQADGQGKLQLKEMHSLGQVHFVSNGIELYCDQADYDPATRIMTLMGTPRPGRAISSDGKTTGTFDKLRYNTEDETVIDGKNIKGKMER